MTLTFDLRFSRNEKQRTVKQIFQTSLMQTRDQPQTNVSNIKSMHSYECLNNVEERPRDLDPLRSSALPMYAVNLAKMHRTYKGS